MTSVNLKLQRTRQRRQHVSTRFGLPEGVDDGAIAATDDSMIPQPGFGIDGFPDRSQDFELGQIVLLHPIVAELHEGANGRRRRVKFADAVLGANFPEAPGIGIEGNALEDDASGAIH